MQTTNKYCIITKFIIFKTDHFHFILHSNRCSQCHLIIKKMAHKIYGSCLQYTKVVLMIRYLLFPSTRAAQGGLHQHSQGQHRRRLPQQFRLPQDRPRRQTAEWRQHLRRLITMLETCIIKWAAD